MSSKNFIRKLPDDALCQILHEALASDVDPDDWNDELEYAMAVQCHPMDAVRLSHVSKWFYAVVVGDSSFWAFVQRGMPHGLLRVCVERSRDRGLFVDIRFLRVRTSLDDFFNAITPSQTRWRVLVIRLEGAADYDLKLLETRVENMELSNAEQLTITYRNGWRTCDEDPELDISRGLQLDLFSKTPLLKLRAVQFVNCVPRSFIAPTLTSMNVELGLVISEDFTGWDFAPFFAFLNSTPTLTDLAVTIEGDTIMATIYGATMEVNAPSSVISYVTKLQLSTWNSHSDALAPSFKTCVEALQFPAVETLQVVFKQDLNEGEEDGEEEDEGEESLTSHLNFVLGSQTRFPNLSNFHVVTAYQRKYTIPFHYLPNLRRLYIDALASPRYDTSARSFQGLSALETLEFVRCENVDIPWVKQVMDRIKESGSWDGFKQLVVDGCKNTTPNTFSFVPKERLLWKPYVAPLFEILGYI